MCPDHPIQARRTQTHKYIVHTTGSYDLNNFVLKEILTDDVASPKYPPDSDLFEIHWPRLDHIWLGVVPNSAILFYSLRNINRPSTPTKVTALGCIDSLGSNAAWHRPKNDNFFPTSIHIQMTKEEGKKVVCNNFYFFFHYASLEYIVSIKHSHLSY